MSKLAHSCQETMDQIEAAAQAEGPVNDDPVTSACDALIAKLYERPQSALTIQEVDLIKVALVNYSVRANG